MYFKELKTKDKIKVLWSIFNLTSFIFSTVFILLFWLVNSMLESSYIPYILITPFLFQIMFYVYSFLKFQSDLNRYNYGFILDEDITSANEHKNRFGNKVSFSSASYTLSLPNSINWISTYDLQYKRDKSISDLVD